MKNIILICFLLTVTLGQMSQNQDRQGHFQHQGGQRSGPPSLPDSPQLQLQFCLLKNCRNFIQDCRSDENCFQLLKKCPPSQNGLNIIDCFKLNINENQNLKSAMPLYNCINDNCADLAKIGTQSVSDHGSHGDNNK
ncbi:hypothetical protein ABPG74_015675 [Tetrahymena malaccensis]